MDKKQQHEHDILRRWLLACDGQATPKEEAALFRLIASDDDLQTMVACVAQDQSILERLLPERTSGGVAGAEAGDDTGDVPSRLAHPGVGIGPFRRGVAGRSGAWGLFPLPAGAPLPAGSGLLAATLLIGVAFGGWLVGGLADREEAPTSLLAADHSPQSVFVAKVNNCVWGAGPKGVGDRSLRLRDGESLELLEGFAELSIESADWRADVQLEGPAAIVLSSEGLPILRYGKMLVDFSTSSSRGISLNLPLSRVHLSAGSKVGFASLDSESEIHVFDGHATLESLRALSGAGLLAGKRGILISSGESCSITSSQGEDIHVEQGEANLGLFDAGGLIRGGDIHVTADYISAVKSSKPIAYYRFESLKDNSFANDVQDKYALHVTGAARLAGLPGNRYVNFFVGDTGSRYLATKEPITDDLPADYSVEFWMNPSHYHTATIVSFLVPELEPAQVDPLPPDSSEHGLLIELGGYSGNPLTMRPQRLRYLHRHSPDSVGGTQLFSGRTHAVREWQYVACVKEADQMRLYLNGQLAGQAQEAADLAEGLIAVVGQISDGRTDRMYFGELDELAIYDRALSHDELSSHYRAMETFKGHPRAF